MRKHRKLIVIVLDPGQKVLVVAKKKHKHHC